MQKRRSRPLFIGVLFLIGACRSPSAVPLFQEIAATARPPAGPPARQAVPLRENQLAFERVPDALHRDHQFWALGGGYAVQIDPTRLEIAVAPARSVPAPGKLPSVSVPASLPAAPVLSPVLRMALAGANPGAAGAGGAPLAARSRYTVLGADHPIQLENVLYSSLRYRDVYPGIDIDYHGAPGQLEYDFYLAPQADPGRIRLRFDDVRSLEIDAGGALVIETDAGRVRQLAPVAFQEEGGRRVAVSARFIRSGAREIGFEIGPHRRDRPLVIDPMVDWVSYLGTPNSDNATGVAVDENGGVYITGSLYLSVSVPAFMYIFHLDAKGNLVVKDQITGATGTQTSGATLPKAIALSRRTGSVYIAGITTSNTLVASFATLQRCYFKNGGNHGFVARFDQNLKFSLLTCLGGSSSDELYGLALDDFDDVYVTGLARSSDFPGVDAVYTKLVGKAPRYTSYQNSCTPTNGVCDDAYLAVFDSNLEYLRYFTYFGGNGVDVGRGIATRTDLGLRFTEVTIVGGTTPQNGQANTFPTTSKAQGSLPEFISAPPGNVDAFLIKFKLGFGWASGAPQSDDPFIAKDRSFATYLGGSQNDVAYGVAYDNDGSTYLTGQAASNDFQPVTATFRSMGLTGGSDAFVVKLDRSGTSAGYGGLVGGDGDDVGNAIAVDSDGNAYVVGSTTSSAQFPRIDRGFKSSCPSTCADAFIAKVKSEANQPPPSPDGGQSPDDSPIEWASYVGGSKADTGTAVAVDSFGFFYVAGTTQSSDIAQQVSDGGLMPTLSYNGSSDGYAVASGQCGAKTVDLSKIGDGEFQGQLAGGSLDIKTNFGSYDHDWSAKLVLTDVDTQGGTPARFVGGMQLQDVMLDARGFVRLAGIPYVKLSFHAETPGQEIRCKLTWDETKYPSLCSGQCCARLVDFTGPKQVRENRLYVEGVYEINFDRNQLSGMGAPQGGCLLVKQRYEFVAQGASSRCEVAGALQCSRFYPIVEYRLIGKPDFPPGFRVFIPVRIEVAPSERSAGFSTEGAGALLHDNDLDEAVVDFFLGSFGTKTTVVVSSLVTNPLPTESYEEVITNGKPGQSTPVGNVTFTVQPDGTLEQSFVGSTVGDVRSIDNLHYSDKRGVVDLPKIYVVPGCPDCFHVHWKWSSLVTKVAAGFPQFNDGNPIIPPGSTQSVHVGLIRFHRDEYEKDPSELAQPASASWKQDQSGLVSNICTKPSLCESLYDGNMPPGGPHPVFYYEGTSSAPNDTFFKHGTFFSATEGFYTILPDPAIQPL